MPKGKFDYFSTADYQADNLPDEKLLDMRDNAHEGFMLATDSDQAQEMSVEVPPAPRRYN